MRFRYSVIGLAMAGALGLGSAAQANIVFSNEDGDAVTSSPGGPPVATTFTLAAPDLITLIDVYNDALRPPGSESDTITVDIYNASNVLVSTSTANYYSEFANFTVGQPNFSNNAADVNFSHYQSDPNVLLQAGTYTITEDATSAASWSYNSGSGNEGFAAVGDTPVPEPASMAVLGAGAATLAFIRRRRGSAA